MSQFAASFHLATKARKHEAMADASLILRSGRNLAATPPARWCRVGAAIVAVAALPALLQAERRPIDTEKSTLTVLVYKSGLFSALADDHVIDAPLAAGAIDEESRSVALEVRTAEMRVRDPNLASGKRADVQTRMVGPEVLDADRFPSIAFESTTVQPKGADAWTVAGRLTIHGQTRVVTFEATRANGRYRGTVAVKQRDFGIMPISIAGGTVKVKDEIKIQFDIVAR
jgi:polyisoprenoid-binding protein YceI